MLAVFPLYTGRHGYLYLLEEKFAFFAGFTAVWALTLLCLTLPQMRHLYLRQRSLLLWITAFFAAATLSTLLSPYASFLSLHTGRCDGLLTYLLYGCIVLGVGCYGTWQNRWIYVFSASYALCCCIALLQLLGCNPLWLYPDDLNYYSPFIQEIAPFLGTVGNVDLLSGLSCLAIPLCLTGLVCLQTRWRYFLVIPVALGGGVTLAAGVSSFPLAMGATVICCLPVYARLLGQRKWGASSHRVRRLFFGCLLASVGLCMAAFAGILLWPENSGLLAELKSAIQGRLLDRFGSERIRIWRHTVRVIREHRLLGIGPDCLIRVMDPVVTSRDSAELVQTVMAQADDAHNFYLQLMVNFGIVGCIPVVSVALLTWHRIVRSFTSDEAAIYLAPALFCYGIYAAFNNGFCIITPLCALLVAFVLLKVPRFADDDTDAGVQMLKLNAHRS